MTVGISDRLLCHCTHIIDSDIFGRVYFGGIFSNRARGRVMILWSYYDTPSLRRSFRGVRSR